LAVFLLAGMVKGLVGLGLPTITIALTSLVLPLTEAIALIALPTIITNVWQAAVGGRFRVIVRRHWPLIAPLLVALYRALSLAGSLLNFVLLDGPHALLSAAAMGPSMAGMWIGQRIRAGLSIEQFRVAVFTALSLTGLYTVLSRLL